MKRFIALLAALTMILSLCCCKAEDAEESAEKKQSKETEAQAEVSASDLLTVVECVKKAGLQTEEGSKAIRDFAFKIAEKSLSDEENSMISSESVLCALALTANGASGNTLTQFESLFGVDISTLNDSLCILQNEAGDELKFANSVWIRDDENPNGAWLHTVKGYYNASVFKTKFDSAAVLSVNNWVKEKTDGMIEKLIDEFDPDTVMHLINAVSFEAYWQDEYTENDVEKDTFTKQNGEVANIDFMYSEENNYIENDDFTGFIKYYKGGNYAFAGLLPKESGSISEALAKLDGETFDSLISDAKNAIVYTSMPKFKSEYTTELKDVLAAMGLTDAFNESADFSKLFEDKDEKAHIGRVLHKTFIEVSEAGTKAAAVTDVEMLDNCYIPDETETKEVKLNRPYIYVIYNVSDNTPAFIGCNINGN